jgi:nicotinate-nucleotide pyrophosphorylase (carboxylating)
MAHIISGEAKSLLKLGLADDGWPWDWTTLGSIGIHQDPQKKVRAQIIAKAPGIWAGAGIVSAVQNLGSELAAEAGFSSNSFSVKSLVKDGTPVKPGQRVCEWYGPASLILGLERPFLNLASYSSGIATATHELVVQVKKACPKKTPRVTATRKTLPGYRNLAVYGLQMGGGIPHRISLSGGVLIKENHIAAAGSITEAIEGCRAVSPHGLKIEIEVKSIDEMEEALAAHAEVIMLDNFSVEEVRKAIMLLEKKFSKSAPFARPLIEVSGGLNASNIGRYAMMGVDILSVGALTHSVKALDLSLLIDQ